jgi:DNA-binding transcriptional MerR regulator
MPTQQPIYSISEAARELLLSAEWLREGEKRGVLSLARRDRSGHRYYTQADIERPQNRRLWDRSE